MTKNGAYDSMNAIVTILIMIVLFRVALVFTVEKDFRTNGLLIVDLGLVGFIELGR